MNYCATVHHGLLERKKGPPKNHVRKKGISDHIKESATKNCKRQVWMFCKLCRKFNHNTDDCFKNPMNKGDIDVDLEGGDSNEYEDGQVGAA
jgi:hypothetical protein